MSYLAPAFLNPVFDAQKYFRLVLSAMSSPAEKITLANLPANPDSKVLFSTGMAAIALSLCDNQTLVWLQPEADSEAVRHYLRFHCGVVFAETPEQAAFAFIAKPETMPSLSAFAQGTVLYPEQSTTLIISASFSSNTQQMHCQGPGIGGQGGSTRSFNAPNMPKWFWQDWANNQKAFPLGVDMLLLDADSKPESTTIMGFPRTTTVFSELNKKD